MTIEWFGKTCVRISTQEATIVIDPFSAKEGLKLPRFNPDLLIVSDGNADTASINGTPFVIKGPGEYEVKKTFVYGIPIDGEKSGLSTVYLIEAEGISVAHLGNLSHQLANGELERLEGVDILLVPVGGHGVLDAEKASTLISAIEPRMVIPMQYRIPGLKENRDTVNAFAKEMGIKESETTEKLKIAAKDLPQDNMQVVILSS